MSVRFEGVREVEIDITKGHIKLEWWEEDYVELNHSSEGKATVKAVQKGEKLKIVGGVRRKAFNFLRKLDDGRAELEIRVPGDTQVHLQGFRGDIEASEVNFENVVCGGGTLILKNCTAKTLTLAQSTLKALLSVVGSMSINIARRDAELRITELEGNVRANVVIGALRLYLPDTCDARINVASRRKERVWFEGIGPLDPIIGTGKYKVTITSEMGNVTIGLHEEDGWDDV